MNCLKFYFDRIVQEANFCSFIFFIVFDVSFMNLTLLNRFIVLFYWYLESVCLSSIQISFSVVNGNGT